MNRYLPQEIDRLIEEINNLTEKINNLTGAVLYLEIENKILKREKTQLESISRLCPLTGLWNRRAFDERLVAEWERCMHSQAPISLILFDIDHFKWINDTLGHPEGDRVLKALSARWVELTRFSDGLARYGGEEFAIILPDTSGEEAGCVAERLWQHTQLPIVATISIGVATLFPSWEMSPLELIAAADKALYSAKAQGRNRVVVAETE